MNVRSYEPVNLRPRPPDRRKIPSRDVFRARRVDASQRVTRNRQPEQPESQIHRLKPSAHALQKSPLPDQSPTLRCPPSDAESPAASATTVLTECTSELTCSLP